MILDARTDKTYNYWQVYHATRCAVLHCVAWVDTDTQRWGEYEAPDDPYNDAIITHQAKYIFVVPGKRFVIIDPVDTRKHGVDVEASRVVRGIAAHTQPVDNAGARNLFGTKVEVTIRGRQFIADSIGPQLQPVIPNARFLIKKQGGRHGR